MTPLQNAYEKTALKDIYFLKSMQLFKITALPEYFESTSQVQIICTQNIQIYIDIYINSGCKIISNTFPLIQFIFNFKQCICLKVTIIEKEKKRKREGKKQGIGGIGDKYLPSIGHSLYDPSSLSWEGPKPKARSFFQVYQVDSGSNIWAVFCYFLRALASNWVGSGAAGA